MSENAEPSRNESVDPSREQIDDPAAGLDRLKEAVKRILKVPKSDVEGTEDDNQQAGST